MRISIGPAYLKDASGALLRGADGEYTFTEGLSRMREHGYACLDFDMYANTAGELYAACDEDGFDRTAHYFRDLLTYEGLSVHQIHGPWVGDMFDRTPEGRRERFEKMSLALRAASILGARYMAIHPIMPFGCNSPDRPEELYEMNVDFFTRLSHVAERYGTVICLENMPFPLFPLASVPSTLALIRDIGRENVRMCLDTGHANIFPLSLHDCVHTIGRDYLAIVHVHDNMGKTDEHLHPYDGCADFDGFGRALGEIGYEGTVNLECSVPPSSYTTHAERVEQELALAAKARRIAAIAERAR